MGGFSGVRVWAVDHAGRRFVLKRFVDSMGYDQATWVHSLMRHVRSEGVTSTPDLEVTAVGDTVLVDRHGMLWELVEWKPGRATAEPSARQIHAAATALANLHRAAATWPRQALRIDHSRAVGERISRARMLQASPWMSRLSAVGDGAFRERFAQAAAIFASVGGPQAVAQASAWESQPVALQPVLRDVWSDHILFVGEAVTGIIDWHAAGSDTPATDVARLMGSWPGDRAATEMFLDSYRAIRPLSAHESALVPFLRDTGILFGLDNWFRWIMEENRLFADRRKVERRVDFLLAALPCAIGNLAADIRGLQGIRNTLD